LSAAGPLRGLGLVLAAGLAAGCFGMRPTEVPMPTRTLAEGGDGNRCLLLLLPGRGDDLDDFARAGFAEIAAEHGIDAEVVAVDAHMGYFRDRSLLVRLDADVIEPARRRGVDEIWWVGISLGGMASLLVLDERPDAVDGVVLLAPYLGDGPLVDSLVTVGDLAAWRDDPDLPAGPDDLWRRLWLDLQERTATSSERPPIFLGYGDGDRYRGAHRVLAGALPEERVLVLPGGHDWETWSALWTRLAADGLPICRGG
jgi:pimeloyl-ACP methyl ester carboxylesterase